jgi:hypothetical protein
VQGRAEQAGEGRQAGWGQAGRKADTASQSRQAFHCRACSQARANQAGKKRKAGQAGVGVEQAGIHGSAGRQGVQSSQTHMAE